MKDEKELEKKDPWYSPAEISYTPEEIEWLLWCIDRLRISQYPPEPSSDYNDDLSGDHTNKAPFIVAMDYAAEIDSRLDLCGKFGEWAEARYNRGESDDEIAKTSRSDELKIDNRIRQVILFMSGRKRKRRIFPHWRMVKTWRDKQKKEETW